MTSEKALSYGEALDDIHTRFILNLPTKELSSSDRIFFQLEQAWWFYDDFIIDASSADPEVEENERLGKKLPQFKNLKSFARELFIRSPLLSPVYAKFDAMYNEFITYRRLISTYGTILLNDECTKVALCQEYNNRSWTFPSGKINQNEIGIKAAARETYEETGFDPSCSIGITKSMKIRSQRTGERIPWMDLQETNALSYVEGNGYGKRRTCYVCQGVPESFPFDPISRKEVRCVAWHTLENLPKKSHAVLPFLTQLRGWIHSYKISNFYISNKEFSNLDIRHSMYGLETNITNSTSKNITTSSDYLKPMVEQNKRDSTTTHVMIALPRNHLAKSRLASLGDSKHVF